MNMTHPDIVNAERFGMPTPPPDEMLHCKSCKDLVRQSSLDENGLCPECQKTFFVCECGAIIEKGAVCLTCLDAIMKP